jgi:hypothetical protein
VTPEIEAFLNRIGWQHVKWVAPATALSLSVQMTNTDSDGRPRRAAIEQKHVAQLRKAMASLWEAIDALSPESRSLVDVNSCPVEDLGKGIPHSVQGLTDAMEAVVPGVLWLSDILAIEQERLGLGRPKNDAAHRIARTIAEIYVIGLGEKPSYGRRGDMPGPSCEYPKVVAGVLEVFGIKVGDVAAICETAVKDLSDERMARLLVIRSGAHQRQKPSLFDLVQMEKLDPNA